MRATDGGRLMAMEAVDTRARGLRARRESEVVGIGGMLRRLDWPLLVALLALVAYGLWAIDGITMHDAAGSAVTRQGMYAFAGAVLFVAALLVDPDRYRQLRRPIYFGTLAVMIFVLAAGAATRGSKRWIDVGFFTFQPSEFGKVVLVLAVAGFVAERGRAIGSSRALLAAIGYGLAPIVLVFVQPDIGTALVYIAALAAVLFLSGVRWTHLALLAALAVALSLAVLWLLPAAGMNVLKPYQSARLTGFTHPANDPKGATYNLSQSIITVGSGGLRGRGILGATQTRLNYLPEHATDFAFASLSEEHGFFGASVLLLLYLFVVWRALKIVAGARDLYCAVVAGGIAFMFLFQVFVNSAMTMGIAPITGIPLPFVSVGGSSMITNFLAMGILQAIHMRRPARRRA
jgi:rod shape determining protein RodA